MAEEVIAESILKVLKDSRWIGFNLAQAYLDQLKGVEKETVTRNLYESGCMTLTRAKEIFPKIQSSGFIQFIPPRKKLGSAENPITKLFPAAITEQNFLIEIDSLRAKRPSIDYEDDRFSRHSLVDFTLIEEEVKLPVNVKNAGTRFENAQQLVGLDPDDCVPIPVYKAHDALEKEPNLVYSISVDYSLIETINQMLIPQFNEEEKTTWNLLNSYSGTQVRDAEDKFVYGMTIKYWDMLNPNINKANFRLISARKSIRILQKHPRRTPGIGLRAWGTGASAEVNVHISVSDETKSWNEIFDRICKNGLKDIINAINRKRTEEVYDPEI